MMIHSRMARTIGLLAASAAGAQTAIPHERRAGFETIEAPALKRDLSFLASDTFEGRLSAHPGDDRATHWVAHAFAAAGLKPAAVDRQGRPTFIQAVPIIEYVGDSAATHLSLSHDGNSSAWSSPDVTGSFRDNVDVEGALLFAGYGITAPELDYDDYAGVDARGKIVLVFDHEPQETDPKSRFNGTGLTPHATARIKALNAQAHGAIAVLIVAEPNRVHPTNAERIANTSKGVTPRTPVPSQAIADDLLAIPVVTIRDAVASELMAGSATTLAQAQREIDAHGAPASTAPNDSQVRLKLRNRSRRTAVIDNVVGILPGTDPRLGAETILISAHHDHDGIEACTDPSHPPVTVPPDPRPCPRIWHGADDNASGTVGVVALARAFARNRGKPRRSLLFTVFAGEERGLLGSYYMAAHPVRPLATTRAMINFDMIGRDEAPSPQTDGLIVVPADTTNRLNLIGSPYSPDYRRVVDTANAAIGLTIDDRFDRDGTLNVFFRSDQFPFILHGIPAFWWFTGFHPDYHHTTDTVDKIDFAKMTRIVRLAYLTAWQLANMPQPPKFDKNFK